MNYYVVKLPNNAQIYASKYCNISGESSYCFPYNY